MSSAPPAHPFPPPAGLDAEVLRIGRRLGRRPPSAGSAYRAAHDRAMAAIASDPQLRAALFRVVDVAPACRTPSELAEHLAAFLVSDGRRPALVAATARAAQSRLTRAPVGWAASAGVWLMARRFIVGRTARQAAPRLRRLWEGGTATSVDLLGESTVTAQEGRAYADRCLAALDALSAASTRWPARPLLERDRIGPLPRANLSVKVTALTPLVRPEAPGRGHADAAERLVAILRRARDLGAHVHIDMESVDSRELVLELALDVLGRPEFAAGPSAGLVLQAYLRDSEAALERLLDWNAAVGRAVPLTIRLVKGAYWDHEVIEATQRGWDLPVWSERGETDRCYERLTRRLIDAYPQVRPAIASHNLRSVAHAIAYARSAGLEAGDIEVQVLRGLGDDLQQALVREGLRGRTYCPVGDLVEGMAYLVRRLLENTANDSFLASRATGAKLDELLRRP